MGNAVYLNHFLAMGLAAQNYLLNHILVWNMLVQLIVVGLLYLLARLAAEAVRPWLRRQLARHPLMEHSLPHLTKVITARLLSPIFAVVVPVVRPENRRPLSLAQSRDPHHSEPVPGLGDHSPVDLPDEKPHPGQIHQRHHLDHRGPGYRASARSRSSTCSTASTCPWVM